jgi:hypothetical protein
VDDAETYNAADPEATARSAVSFKRIYRTHENGAEKGYPQVVLKGLRRVHMQDGPALRLRASCGTIV